MRAIFGRMDSALLLDICVWLATTLCVALLVYGAWLCLLQIRQPDPKRNASAQAKQSEAIVRAPRRRVRAGVGGQAGRSQAR